MELGTTVQSVTKRRPRVVVMRRGGLDTICWKVSVTGVKAVTLVILATVVTTEYCHQLLWKLKDPKLWPVDPPVLPTVVG